MKSPFRGIFVSFQANQCISNRVTSPSSQSGVMVWSSQSLVTKTAESFWVIGLQPRVK